MRLLICGSRNFDRIDSIRQIVEEYQSETIIHGGALGADTLAGEVAKEMGIPVMLYLAHWKQLGKAAGPMRNPFMLDDAKPDRVVAFPMKDSRGTWDMVRRTQKAGVPIRVVEMAEDW